jgi:hypothetical protein
MADLTFKGYAVQDTGIQMDFVNFFPGPGKPTDYSIFLTDAELSAVATQVQLRTLVTTKLQRKLQAAGIATKLDQFIGQTVTI